MSTFSHFFSFLFLSNFFLFLKVLICNKFFLNRTPGGDKFCGLEKYLLVGSWEYFFLSFHSLNSKSFWSAPLFCLHLFFQQSYRLWGRRLRKHIEISFDFRLAVSLACRNYFHWPCYSSSQFQPHVDKIMFFPLRYKKLSG